MLLRTVSTASAARSELDDVCAFIASAVELQEGQPGVLRVLLSIKALGSASTRAVSRQTHLPLPVVAAVHGELRRAGLLTNDRPSTLTAHGRELLETLPAAQVDVLCAACDGAGVTIPMALTGAASQLQEAMGEIPQLDRALDQSHCTVETKLRRVLTLLRDNVLPSRGVLLLGDDDLMALTLDIVGQSLGFPLAESVGVIDTSEPILSFQRERLATSSVRFEFAEHDLRDPIPEAWRHRYDVAMTDPPYTERGAELFLSRALEGLQIGAGHPIAFSFASKGPAEAVMLSDKLHDLGLVVSSLAPNFNAYLGAGAIGAHSSFYQLTTTGRSRPTIEGHYAEAIYTADKRGAARTYLCLHCRARHEVGPGTKWTTIEALRSSGCPECGQQRLRPLSLVEKGPHK
jgi:predicted methyltransferase